MIDIDQLKHRYGSTEVLSLDRWTLSTGEAAIILGRSGSGKSTLLNILTGLLTPSSGRVRIRDVEVSSLSASARDDFRGRTFGIVFQTLRLISSLTVRQNLALARSLAGRAPDHALADRLLDRLGIAALAERKPRELSVGESQRAAIARAAVSEPAILVADEPTSALDDENAAVVAALLRSIAADVGSTVIVATHDHRIKEAFGTQLVLQPAVAR